MTRVAVLDDYQNVARDMADWDFAPAGRERGFLQRSPVGGG